MKPFWLVILIVFSPMFAQSQNVDDIARRSFLKTDKELGLTYKKVLEEYRSDTLFVRNFERAQQLWVKLRDAELSAKFPDNGDGPGSTSIRIACWYKYKEELTRGRIQHLRAWIGGIKEGDVCAGSVKLKALR